MLTLTEAIQAGAASKRPVTSFDNRDILATSDWHQLHERARKLAAVVSHEHDVRLGARVAILSSSSLDTVALVQAIWILGGAVSILPIPRRSQLAEFVRQVNRQLLAIDATLLLVAPEAASIVEALDARCPVGAIDAIVQAAVNAAEKDFRDDVADDATPAVLQLTSGSTEEPRVVEVPRSHVVANVFAIQSAARVSSDDDTVVSWLPLFHDMGLLGFMVLPMLTGTALALAGPEAFMARPQVWMEAVSRFRGTLTGAPSFAYAVAARRLPSLSVDLSSLRLAFNGSEPIDPDTARGFLAAGAGRGLRAETMFCVYGLAEATLAVTFPPPERGLRTDTVDGARLQRERVAAPPRGGSAASQELCFVGASLPGTDVRLMDPASSRELGDREVGEILVSGTSVSPGYYGDPAATARSFRDGGMRTGDLGYMADGELVVCGRLKDIIIVGGRNIAPEELERATESVVGVRPGNSVALGVTDARGRELIVVLAEVSADDHDIRSSIATAVRDVADVTPREILLLPPGTLPKTPSGKRQRSLSKDRFLAGEYQTL